MTSGTEIQDKLFIHKEHVEWTSKLDYYQDEIKFFQNELFQVIKANPNDFSIMEKVDEYRKLFMKKLSQIDEIRNSIFLHEHKLVVSPNDKSLIQDHHLVRNEFYEYGKNYDVLKNNFRRFASHHD